MVAPPKHRACNRPGRPFCDKACSRIRGIATNPPCDKPIEDYSTLHRAPRKGFVTEGPRQRFATGGGTATNPYFESQPYIYVDHKATYRALCRVLFRLSDMEVALFQNLSC